jgi:GntR family transcriptional regulator / MocR family aminotransferase
MRLVQLWEPTPPVGKGTWLREHLVAAIHTGELAAGSSLPGARDLADAAGVSRGTVDAVYTQLADEGFLQQVARHRATVVGTHGRRPPTLAPPTSAAPPPTPGVPDANLFPHRAWAAAARAALNGLARRDLGYPDPSGHPVLRHALAGWLARTRRVSVTPDAVHVTGGVSHAMWLLAGALDASTWAVERPGSAGSSHVLAHVVDCLPVRLDAAGMVPREIPEAARSVLLTPSHQYPTGTVMPVERRREVVDTCRTGGRWLVEDDFDSHLAVPGVVPGAMQALAPDGVILMGSLSKLLAPGLRLGWIVAPPDVIERLRDLRQRTDQGGSVITQLTVAELITSGELDRHLRHARREYQLRRERLALALAPRWTLSGAPVGVYGFVRTRTPDDLVERLADADVPSAVVDDEDWAGVVVSVAAFREQPSNVRG